MAIVMKHDEVIEFNKKLTEKLQEFESEKNKEEK